MLSALGLTSDQTVFYSALVGLPPITAAEIAVKLGADLDQTRRLLRELEAIGLASRRGPLDRWAATPPTLALGTMIAERESGLRAAQQQMNALTELYRSASAHRSFADVVDIVEGDEAIMRRTNQLIKSAKTRVDVFATEPAIRRWQRMTQLLSGPPPGGPNWRVVMARAVLEIPEFVNWYASDANQNVETRVVPKLISRLVIVDDRYAVVPLYTEEDSESASLFVEASGLVRVLTDCFERIWRTAQPITQRLPDANGPDDLLQPLDRSLLHLLSLGFTDAVAANQLRLSIRTVQRRVAMLMEVANVQSRLQLGMSAVRRGWL